MTLLDIYQKALARPPRAPFLRAKQGGGYQDVTAGDFSRQGEALAASLAALGVRQGDRVAILSENRPEWLLSDYALVRLRAVSVPLHATLPAAQVQAILPRLDGEPAGEGGAPVLADAAAGRHRLRARRRPARGPGPGRPPDPDREPPEGRGGAEGR